MLEYAVHCIAGRDAHPFREVDQDSGDRALAVHASLLARADAARASNALPSEGIVRPEGTPGARRHPEITLIVLPPEYSSNRTGAFPRAVSLYILVVLNAAFMTAS